MIEFRIKTWSCECGYSQDFEPISELMIKNGFSGINCPSCKKGELVKETDENKKKKMRVREEHDEIEDIEEKKVKIVRKEEFKTPKEIQALRDKYEDK
uniref:Uncharacterized protein n=1 Tax=viral metagenome TaxID=1070528 RepID=A0A6M3Y403_9ZZZZ